MEELTPQFLSLLCKYPDEPMLSLYAPSSVSWPEVKQNRIRWENLFRQAEVSLMSRGWKEEEVEDFLRPVAMLIQGKDFRASSAASIGIFHSASLTASVALPNKVPEQVVVASHFLILPLISALGGLGTYYVLALSKNAVRLFEGNGERLAEVSLPSLPKGQTLALKLDPRSPSFQTHGGVSHGKAGRSSVVHGQGGPTDWSKDELKSYFREIDQALQPFLAGFQVPLVLACVDYYEPLYREVNSYPHLLSEHISGSPDAFTDRDLLTQAWRIVALVLADRAHTDLRRCEALQGTPQFSTELEKIILAARAGQVETLLVAENIACWGIFDSVADRVKIFDEQLPESEDLLNLAAIETLNTGGRVVLVSGADLPQGSEVAATFRYEPIDIEYVARMDQAESPAEQ